MSIIGAIFFWSIFGLIIGLLAKFIMPGKDPAGIMATIGIGIAGSIIGGAIGKLLNIGKVSGYDFTSILLAVGGSIILLYLFRKLKKQK